MNVSAVSTNTQTIAAVTITRVISIKSEGIIRRGPSDHGNCEMHAKM